MARTDILAELDKIQPSSEESPDFVDARSGQSSLALVAAVHLAYREMLDFLGDSPGPRRIVDFKISAAAQERLELLLEKNRDEGLDDEEATELDVYELVHHSMIRLKGHARMALAGSA
jgi:hypothetical protein